MNNTLAAVRHRLKDLHHLAAQTAGVEKKILEAAEKRLIWVNREIAVLEKRLPGDEASEDSYRQLIIERGRLHQVIANAEEHLKS